MTMSKNTDKKNLFYAKFWSRGVGCGGFSSYAFTSDEEREKWMNQRRFVIAEEEGDPVVCYADYEDMQKSYGNNFCVILDKDEPDHYVCTRREAIMINREFDVEYI